MFAVDHWPAEAKTNVIPCPDRLAMKTFAESITSFQHELPAEEALLLHCANRTLSESSIAQASNLLQEVNWERFLQLSYQHGVAGLVFRCLNAHFIGIAPDEVVADLRRYVILNTHNNLGLLREIVNTVALLNEQRIKFAVFKGLITAELAYGDFSIRRCNDIDILVAGADHLRVKALFLSEGFEQTMSSETEFLCMQSGLWHESRKLNIDLHWGIPPRELGIHADRILKNRSSITLAGNDIPTFAKEDMFIILCVNATKEFWDQQLYRYCDIHEFLQRHPDLDWKLIVNRARGLRCKRMLLSGLGIVKALYGSPLPAEIDARLTRNASVQRVVSELLQQLFDHKNAYRTELGGARHLYYFHSPSDYFATLIDNRAGRFLYKALLRRLLRVTADAQGSEPMPATSTRSLLSTAARSPGILGLVLQKLYRKLNGARPDSKR
jgi:hypothetical protein